MLEWWIKNKNRIYAVIIFVVGLLGGNVDRLSSILNSVVPENQETIISIENINAKIDNLEKNQLELKNKVEFLSDRVELVYKICKDREDKSNGNKLRIEE